MTHRWPRVEVWALRSPASPTGSPVAVPVDTRDSTVIVNCLVAYARAGDLGDALKAESCLTAIRAGADPIATAARHSREDLGFLEMWRALFR